MPRVVVYSTSTCPFCIKLKEFLKINNIKFKEYNVAEDAKARDTLIEKSGQMGVPVTIIGEKIIVGFDQEELRLTLNIGV